MEKEFGFAGEPLHQMQETIHLAQAMGNILGCAEFLQQAMQG